jgi:hypothetical protein
MLRFRAKAASLRLRFAGIEIPRSLSRASYRALRGLPRPAARTTRSPA